MAAHDVHFLDVVISLRGGELVSPVLMISHDKDRYDYSS
jgi:hypothetical protein